MTNIQDLSFQLRLSYIRDNAETLIVEARQTQLDYADFLQNLLLLEVERRTENGITRRIKDARFPVKKYLVDFDKDKYDKAFAPKFKKLETLEFIENKETIILIGTPGEGKTHYVTALGIAA